MTIASTNRGQCQLPGLTDVGEIFRRLYFNLYSNSRASRAERIHEDLSLLLLVKLATETLDDTSTLDRFIDGEGSANDRLLPILHEAYPEFVDDQRHFSLGEPALRTALRDLDGVRLSGAPAHVLGDAFQALMGPRLRGERGQFFTPRSLVRAMIEIIAPLPSEDVLDPACGTGGFLVETFLYWRRQGEQPTGRLVGIEKDDGLASLARSLLVLTAGRQGMVHSFDSLNEREWESNVPTKHEFDVVLTNPPFGAKIGIRTAEILRTYDLAHQWIEESVGAGWKKTSSPLPSQDPQILFIEQCMRRLRPGGRMAIVLPEGVFGNRTSGYVWDWLHDQGNVYALLDCPRTTFQPGTDTKTNVLFFQKTGRLNARNSKKTSVGIALHSGHDRRGRNTRADGQMYQDDFASLGREFHISRSKLWARVNITNPHYLVPRYYVAPGPIDAEEAELVEGADTRTIGDLVSEGLLRVAKGHEVGAEAYGTGDIPFVRTSDLANFEIRVDPTNGVSEEVYRQYSSQQRLKPGNVLLVVDGRYRIGTSAIVTETNYRCVVQSHLRILALAADAGLSPYSLLFALNLPSVKLRIRNLVFIQSTLGTLGKRLFELQIPLLRGSGPWTERLKAFEFMLRKRDRILAQLTKMATTAVEL